MDLLIVDDDDTLRDLLSREFGRSGHRVVSAATAADCLRQVEEAEPQVVLLDLTLPDASGVEVLRKLRAERPDLQVVVLTAHGTVDTAIEAMKLGAFDYLQKPCHLQELEFTLLRASEQRRLSRGRERLRNGNSVGGHEAEFLGCGKIHEDLVRFIAKVASSDSTVLIRGETGTGKELIARSVHRQSQRRAAPFIVVDCAALNENLLQSELFGHEKGAFTGAVKQKQGLFEIANKGTIFLDEMGDVSPAIQAGLLRVLESSTFRRLGGTQELSVDVRLLAATNRNLERMMKSGQFREDLYFRLNTISVEVPPLRQRTEEIPSLAHEFIKRHGLRSESAKSVTPGAMAALQAYHWPGNVRELRHVIERAMVLADGDSIDLAELPPEIRRARTRSSPLPAGTAMLSLTELERRHIGRVLVAHGNHRARVAQVLGISERSLYRKLREYHLEATASTPEEEEEAGPNA